MSEEFTKLQDLINKERLELKIKKSLMRNDTFGVWIYWQCKTKPSLINLFGFAFYIYFILTTDWLWIPLSVFIGIKYGWIYGILIWSLHYFIQIHIFKRIGQGFFLYDAQKDEELFDDLWQNQNIGIVSVKKHESAVHRYGIPDIIIDPSTHDWREEINRFIDLSQNEPTEASWGRTPLKVLADRIGKEMVNNLNTYGGKEQPQNESIKVLYGKTPLKELMQEIAQGMIQNLRKYGGK